MTVSFGDRLNAYMQTRVFEHSPIMWSWPVRECVDWKCVEHFYQSRMAKYKNGVYVITEPIMKPMKQ